LIAGAIDKKEYDERMRTERNSSRTNQV